MSRMYQERVQSFNVIEECDQNEFNVPTDLSRNASNENFNYEITNDGHHSHCMWMISEKGARVRIDSWICIHFPHTHPTIAVPSPLPSSSFLEILYLANCLRTRMKNNITASRPSHCFEGSSITPSPPHSAQTKTVQTHQHQQLVTVLLFSVCSSSSLLEPRPPVRVLNAKIWPNEREGTWRSKEVSEAPWTLADGRCVSRRASSPKWRKSTWKIPSQKRKSKSFACRTHWRLDEMMKTIVMAFEIIPFFVNDGPHLHRYTRTLGHPSVLPQIHPHIKS